MNKQEIIQEITKRHQSFIEYIGGLSDDKFLQSNNNKWSAGQQLEHIFLSVRPINIALSAPRVVFRIFGLSNSSKTYDEVVKAYQHKLDTGSKASFLYVPNKIGIEQKQELIEKLNQTIQSIVQKLGKLQEVDLDKIVLPHPILGNLTMRELMYFTLYHVQHHEQVIKKNLELWEK